MANEADVVKVLKEINMAQLQVVDTGAMSYYEQLKVLYRKKYRNFFYIHSVDTQHEYIGGNPWRRIDANNVCRRRSNIALHCSAVILVL